MTVSPLKTPQSHATQGLESGGAFPARYFDEKLDFAEHLGDNFWTPNSPTNDSERNFMAKQDEKDLGGCPLKFETPDDLQSAIDAYFEYPDGGAWMEMPVGDTILKQFAPTMSGLAFALGVDRKTITNYSHRDGFSPHIKKARVRVEEALEQRLYAGSPAGVIFNLKNNFGWRDKQEIEHSEKVVDSGDNEW